MVDMLIKGGTVVTMNPERKIIKEGAIAIKENKIICIGKTSQLEKEYKADKIIDVTGKLILPGFINAHTHVLNILLRGLSQDRVLLDWLLNVIIPGRMTYTPEDARVGATLYCIEAIRSGITTIVDNDSLGWRRGEALVESTIEVYNKVGIRAVCARMFSDAMAENQARDLVEDTKKALRSIDKLMRKHNTEEKNRIRVWPSPTNPHAATEEGLLGSLELARKYDTMVAIHLAETSDGVEHYGMSSTEYLSTIGFLDPRVLAAHCVWIHDKDLRLLKLNDVKVAHNPVSNMLLASGIAPIPKMLVRGITVGIGTDDSDYNSVNMISDMKFAASIHKSNTLDPNAITCEKVLEMATIDGAKAIGMEDEIGSIEVGKKADLIILNMDYPHLRPCHHIPSALIYHAKGTEIETTIIDGKIVMENKNLYFIDSAQETYMLAKAQEASEGIIERAHLQRMKDRGWKSFA